MVVAMEHALAPTSAVLAKTDATALIAKPAAITMLTVVMNGLRAQVDLETLIAIMVAILALVNVIHNPALTSAR